MSFTGNEKRAEELGSRIKKEIKAAGMSQVEFAVKLGISPSRLSNYITGARMPDVFTLFDIAGQLGVSVDYLHDPECVSGSFPGRYMLTVYSSGNVRMEKV